MRFSGSMCFFNPLSGFFIHFTLFFFSISISILFTILLLLLHCKASSLVFSRQQFANVGLNFISYLRDRK